MTDTDAPLPLTNLPYTRIYVTPQGLQAENQPFLKLPQSLCLRLWRNLLGLGDSTPLYGPKLWHRVAWFLDDCRKEMIALGVRAYLLAAAGLAILLPVSDDDDGGGTHAAAPLNQKPPPDGGGFC